MISTGKERVDYALSWKKGRHGTDANAANAIMNNLESKIYIRIKKRKHKTEKRFV